MGKRNPVKRHGELGDYGTGGGKLYTGLPMALARDLSLSHNARSIALYVWSHDDSWQQSIGAIMAALKMGRQTVVNALAELQDRGWFVREIHYQPDKLDAAGRPVHDWERWHLQMTNRPFTAAQTAALATPSRSAGTPSSSDGTPSEPEGVTPSEPDGHRSGYQECNPRGLHDSRSETPTGEGSVQETETDLRGPVFGGLSGLPMEGQQSDERSSEPSDDQRETEERESALPTMDALSASPVDEDWRYIPDPSVASYVSPYPNRKPPPWA